MTDRTQLLTLLVAMVVAIACPALLIWWVDPIQVYRRDGETPQNLHHLPRHQNAGLIRTYLADPGLNFDTIIMGTSLSQNFSPSQVESALASGGVLKLAMSGSRAPSHHAVVEAALKTGAVERVLWEIVGRPYAVMPFDELNTKHVFPRYLYEGGLGMYQYLFNIDHLDNALVKMGLREPKRRWNPQGDQWASWYRGPENWDRFRARHFRDNAEAYRSSIGKGSLAPLDSASELLEQFGPSDAYGGLFGLTQLARQYPAVQFDFFFPPVSTAFYAQLEPEELALRVGLTRRAVELLSPLPNVKVHGFANVESIVGDLSLFRDLLHYHPRINDWMAAHIEEGDHVIHGGNIDIYEQSWFDQIRRFSTADLDEGIERSIEH